MMRLALHEFLTLDGVMQGPGDADEDRSGGFAAGGWQVPYNDDIFGEIVASWFATPSTALLGRNTFEMFRDYWPQVSDADPVARDINHGRKIVVAHEGYEPEWENTTVLPSADPLPEIARLKDEGDGMLRVSGSWQLATALHEAGLVDEYHLIYFPVTVGHGKRLFSDSAPPRGFTVKDTKVTGTGAVYLLAVPQPFSAGTYVVEDGLSLRQLDPQPPAVA